MGKKIIFAIEIDTESAEETVKDLIAEIIERQETKNHSKRKSLDEILEKALKDAPSIEEYTIRQLSNTINSPWPISRWHLETLEVKRRRPHPVFRI